MANEIDITVSANETASDVITGIGDSTQRTERVIVQSMGTTEAAFDTAMRSASGFGATMDATAGGAGQLADGLDGISQVTQGVSDVMNHAERRAEDLSRAQTDVAQAAQDASQAIEDMNQANRDAAQAGIDAEQAAIDQKQALIDQKKAEDDLAEARKKNDPAAIAQAENDIKQAKLDGKQATEDLAQANRDAVQAGLDGKQALIDQKAATTELSASQRELANQSGIMSQVSDWTSMFGGILSGLVGIIGLVTAAQWLWNLAMTANPIGLVVAAIVILIGIIVLIATKTTWFQQIWQGVWLGIIQPVRKAWNWLRENTAKLFSWLVDKFKTLPTAISNSFKTLATAITSPFRAAFRAIASLWNRTVGSINFTIPGWVPSVGGNHFAMPTIPQFATGGDVLRSGYGFLHAGERIIPRASAMGLAQRAAQEARKAKRNASQSSYSGGSYGNGDIDITVTFESILSDSKIMNVINDGIRAYVKSRGGNVQIAYGRGSTR